MSLSATQTRYTLDTLATQQGQMRGACPPQGPVEVIVCEKKEIQPVHKAGSWNPWLWLLIIFLIALALLAIFQPAFVRSTNAAGASVLNWGLAVLWALVIAIVIVLIAWLARGTCAVSAV